VPTLGLVATAFRHLKGILVNDTVHLAWYQSRVEAELAAGLLKANGIEAVVNVSMPGYGEVSGARVLVLEEDLARAKDLISAAARDPRSVDEAAEDAIEEGGEAEEQEAPEESAEPEEPQESEETSEREPPDKPDAPVTPDDDWGDKYRRADDSGFRE
jgi:hypothetical protein